MNYLNAFFDSFIGSWNWTIKMITFQVDWYNNYFYGLILISLLVWGLEIMFPWRKQQSIFRKDFWLDGFYMFFNFFIFSIAISGFYEILGLVFNEFGITTKSLALIPMENLPNWGQLLVFFILSDFVQWFTHVLLHRYAWMWNFHKVHHSVKEMGFAAHLRYHWMENILYKPLKTLAVMVLAGFDSSQAFIVHFFSITIGHLNHANIHLTYGPLKYIFNNPVMHLWHHVKALPEGRTHGINFGISLSIWDYIFKTASIPKDDANIELGFPGDEKFPQTFKDQLVYGFKKD